MERIIFHVDVNNAFLSWTAVYLLKNGYETDIRTIPSVIGGDEEKRHGIVLAKSPVAKKYGIKTAETLYLARKKCPNVEVFPANYEYYCEQSQNLYNYLSQYTPLIEQFSVDECFMDLTNTKYLYDDILALAYKIKDEIKNMFGFTVNVGIGNNKLCAKMASDFQKPDKVHTLFNNEIELKMWPLPIEDLLYIGKSSSAELKKLGINTIGDLAHTNVNYLQKHFKNRSIDMINSANGIDNSPVNNDVSKNKCISVSSTLPEDTNNESELKQILLDMCDQVGLRARREGSFARTIAITAKTSSFRSFSKQKKVSSPTNNTMEIYNKVLEIFEELDKNELIRNIGVRLSDLTDNRQEQISLFQTNKKETDDSLQKLVDNINSKYKNTKIMPAIFYENKSNNDK